VDPPLLRALNLCNESLGLTAALAPVPSAAAALHQLWQLAAAEFRDALAMWECPSADFHGLSRLRNACIYLRLLRTDLAALLLAPWLSAVGGAWAPAHSSPVRGALHLPGAGGRGAAFTTFLSPAFIPFYGAAALTDEVYHLQKCVVPRQTSSLWTKNFGGNSAVASFLAWRLTVWWSLVECCEWSVHPAERQVRECLSRNHAALAARLDRAGALWLRWRPRGRGAHRTRPSRLGGRRFRVAAGLAGWEEPWPVVQWALDLALRDYGQADCGSPRPSLALPHAAFADCAAAVKPEKMLRLLLQELDESPAREQPALGAAALPALTGDGALEYCLGL
jgi:hypothetical protein